MIFPIIKHEFKANLKSLIIWTVGLIVLVYLGFFKFSSFLQTGQSIDQLFNLMPRVVLVMFGAGQLPLDTPQGFYACMFLWIALAAYTHAVLLGSTILSKEEKDKTAEFLFTKPVKRSTVITAKIVVGVLNLLVLAVAGYFSTIFSFLPAVQGVNLHPDVLITFIGMFFTQLIFFFFGLFISTATKTAKKATNYSAIFLFACYFGGVATEMAEQTNFDFLNPMRYFNCVNVMQNGFDIVYFVLFAFLTSLFILLSYKFFKTRNLQI